MKMGVRGVESLNFEIPSNLNSISSAVSGVMQYLSGTCIDINESLIFEIRVILNELLINSIVHGNKKDPEKKIMIKVGISRENKFFIYVEDEGAGYDFRKYLNNKVNYLPLAEVDEHGRGVMIVESLCDKINYNKRGNKVVVHKKLYPFNNSDPLVV